MNIWAITKRELKAYFYSPIAYVVFALFLLLSGYFFAFLLGITREASMRAVSYNIVVTLLFFVPLLTMRLFAEERKLGTLEILMTKPVKDYEVVLGKFLASFGFYLLMLAATLIYVMVLGQYGNPDLPVVWNGYLGMALVGACLISIGVFASTLSENQIIAAIITFALGLGFWIIGWLSGVAGFEANGFFEKISLSSRFDDFLKGVLDFRGVIFYVSFAFFWLFATVKSIEIRKWK